MRRRGGREKRGVHPRTVDKRLSEKEKILERLFRNALDKKINLRFNSSLIWFLVRNLCSLEWNMPNSMLMLCLTLLFKISFEFIYFSREFIEWTSYRANIFIHESKIYWKYNSRENGYKNKDKIRVQCFKEEIGVLRCKKEQERRNTYLDQSHPNPMYQLVTFFNNHERGYVLPSHHPITVIESGHDDTHAYQIYSKSQCVTRCSRSPREGRRARRVTSPWYSITCEYSDRQTGGCFFPPKFSQWRFKYRRNIINGDWEIKNRDEII